MSCLSIIPSAWVWRPLVGLGPITFDVRMGAELMRALELVEQRRSTDSDGVWTTHESEPYALAVGSPSRAGLMRGTGGAT